ncbi:unnamed protein product, partial [Lota lota]
MSRYRYRERRRRMKNLESRDDLRQGNRALPDPLLWTILVRYSDDLYPVQRMLRR